VEDLGRRRAGPQATELLAGRLLDSACAFARTALAAYRNEDWAVFNIHLATALEHLVKGALAYANPAYIADARSFDALLHLTGRGDRASTPEFVKAARTITLTEAMDRVARLVDGYPNKAPLVQVLLDRRNGVVHAGTIVRGQEADILGEVARHATHLLPFVHRTPADLWGEGDAFVAELAEHRISEIVAAYRRHVDAARLRFAALAERLGQPALDAFVSAREANNPSDDYSAFPIECPACGHLGMLRGEPEPIWEADYDNDGDDWYVSGTFVDRIRFAAFDFYCDVCGLSLETDELEPAGLRLRVFTDDEFDLSDATDYFRALEHGDDDYDYYAGR
jgi:hypothetical protein